MHSWSPLEATYTGRNARARTHSWTNRSAMVKEIESEAEYKAAVGKGAALVDFYAVW